MLINVQTQVITIKFENLSTLHCAKVQKYEQGKLDLQLFDMWW
jgi:hypothetical protein